MTRFVATGEKLGFLIKEKERTHQHNSDCYLTVLTTYCCVAMAGLTKSGLGPPGSHIAELFRKHAVAYHGSPEESRAHFLMWGEEYLEQVSQSSCHIIQLVQDTDGGLQLYLNHAFFKSDEALQKPFVPTK